MSTTTYKYLYTKKDVEGIQCSIITGSDNDHAQVIKKLNDDPTVLLALREYVCTYEVDKIGLVDKIKIEEVTNNEKESSN